MLLNQAFVPGRKYTLSRVQVGGVNIDTAEFEVEKQIHTERTFTSGWGGATKIDVKGYTVTGRIQAYIKRVAQYSIYGSGSPETAISNLPADGQKVRFKLWSGGFYAEGDGVITSIKPPTVSNGKFVTLDISFESDGIWNVMPNVVELV